MKKSLLLILLASLWATSSAQLTKNERGSMLGSRQGIYVSLGVGPVFGSINNEVSGTDNYLMKYSGTTALIDFKLGFTLIKSIIVHADFIKSTISRPTIKISDNPSIKTPSGVHLKESMMGVGITSYRMPENMFISGTIGFGIIKLKDSYETYQPFTTERSLAFQLKVGKEWLISSAWGIGVAATYGRTIVKELLIKGNGEKLTSSRLGIVLNATINQVE